MWWAIKVIDPNGVEWEHRVLFDRGQFWGLENLHRVFPSDVEWQLFLGQLLAADTGELNNLVNKDKEVNHLSWHRMLV